MAIPRSNVEALSWSDYLIIIEDLVGVLAAKGRETCVKTRWSIGNFGDANIFIKKAIKFVAKILIGELAIKGGICNIDVNYLARCMDSSIGASCNY